MSSMHDGNGGLQHHPHSGSPMGMGAAHPQMNGQNAQSASRWRSQGSSSSSLNANGHRNMMLLERRLKSNEIAVQDMNHALLDETLTALRKKADALNDDKWMFQDVHI